MSTVTIEAFPRDNWAKWLQIQKPDWLILNPFRKELDNQELTEIRSRLIKYPVDLGFVATMPLSDINSAFPGIFAGRYLADLSSISQQTKYLLQNFGSRGDIFNRTTRVISSLVTNEFDMPKAGNFVVKIFEFLWEIQNDATRKTGEPALNHQIRAELGIIDKLVKNQFFLNTRTPEARVKFFNPLSRKNRNKTGLTLAAFPFHDYVEEVVGTQFYDFRSEGTSIILQTASKNAEYIITFDKLRNMNFFHDLVIAYTNDESARSGNSDFEKAFYNSRRLMKLIRDPKSDPVVKWAVEVGKAEDREDNTRTLWTHPPDKLLNKLNENMLAFRKIFIPGWSYDRSYSPPVVSLSLLLLMGATYDELFGWIYKNDHIKYIINRLDENNIDYAIVPEINHVTLFIAGLPPQIISRPGIVIERGGQMLDLSAKIA